MRVRYSFSSRRTGNIDKHNKHRREFPELVRELIVNSDIILEILDAKFIEKTRNKEIEKYAKAQSKKIIYILNKSDLVDINKIRREVELKELIPFVFFSCVNKKGVRNLRTLEMDLINILNSLKSKIHLMICRTCSI